MTKPQFTVHDDRYRSINFKTHFYTHQLSAGQLRYFKYVARSLSNWEGSDIPHEKMHAQVIYAMNMIHDVYRSYNVVTLIRELGDIDYDVFGVVVHTPYMTTKDIQRIYPEYYQKHIEPLEELVYSLRCVWHWHLMQGHEDIVFNEAYMRHVIFVCNRLLDDCYGIKPKLPVIEMPQIA